MQDDRRFQQVQPGVATKGMESDAGFDASVASVLKNTYLLLSATIAFSALTAYLSMGLPYPGFLITIAGFYGLLFLTYKTQNSAWGILSTFALTGFMGYTLGPIIGMFAGAGAMDIVANAFGMTAMVFLGLSGYVLVTKKDMSFLSGFLMAGFFVLIGAMILSFFIQSSAFSLAISAGFAVFSSAAILFETSSIIHGGQRNYISATVSLYVAIYNLFVSLLNILSILGGDD